MKLVTMVSFRRSPVIPQPFVNGRQPVAMVIGYAALRVEGYFKAGHEGVHHETKNIAREHMLIRQEVE